MDFPNEPLKTEPGMLPRCTCGGGLKRKNDFDKYECFNCWQMLLDLEATPND